MGAMLDHANHDYPTALAAGPEHGDRGLRDGLKWLISKVPDVGGDPLILAPGRANMDGNAVLSAFVKKTGVAVATWRGPARGWSGGPVLVARPTREKLGEIADDLKSRHQPEGDQRADRSCQRRLLSADLRPCPSKR
jgi:hypothetical protein